MNNPKVGSIWFNKTDTREYIKIIEKNSQHHVRKNICYIYLRTGAPGGCHSKEWFYADWQPVDEGTINE